MKLLIFNALVSSYKGLVAGGMNITLETNEMKPEDTASLVGTHRKPVKVMIQQGDIDEGFTDEDLEAFKNADMDEYDQKTTKSPSQRLRGVLYVLFEQDKRKNELIGDQFSDYYHRKLEEIITHLKTKIDE